MLMLMQVRQVPSPLQQPLALGRVLEMVQARARVRVRVRVRVRGRGLAQEFLPWEAL